MSETPIQWSYNPWRERPARACTAVVWILLSVALLTSLGLPWGVRMALIAAVGASLGSALLPGTYRLDASGVTLGMGPFVQRRTWNDVRRVVRSSEGVLLSPFTTRRRLDAYRAVFLPWPRRSNPQVADRVGQALVDHGL